MTAIKHRQIRKWEAHIHAFVAFSQTTDGPDGRHLQGSLSGLTVGVKDVIDVAGLPTQNGSAACLDATPAADDAFVVSMLRKAGAHIIGKTTTTEFAFTDPTNCRNPYDIARSPGGSSSGSGAAVAAGLVDLALGTQTAGSLCRPAAYCGVVGFKPSYGILSRVGVTPLAPSFDTIGIIARSVAQAKAGFLAMAPEMATEATQQIKGLKLASGLLDKETKPTPDLEAAFLEAVQAAREAGFIHQALAFEGDMQEIVADHRLVMNFEAAKAHHDLMRDGKAALLQPRFRAGLEAGALIAEAPATEATKKLAIASDCFWRSIAEVDIIITLPVPDGAPLIDGTTGFQDWLTPWTVFGGPLVCIPWGLDHLGRPMSVMLAAHPGKDLRLLQAATTLEALSPPLPRPEMPKG